MYSIAISIVISLSVFFGLWKSETSLVGWAILWGIIALITSMVALNLILRKRIMAVMQEMQEMLMEGQKRMQIRVNAYQHKPVGDPKRVMAEMEAAQKKLLNQALEYTQKLEPFRYWTPLFGRQLNTTRMQFHYQMQEFKKVDALMPKCLIMEPISAAMKIARLQANKAEIEDIEKAFHKAKARLKYNQSALLYALMSWIYVKNNLPEKAHTLLIKGCEDNENETLKRNRDRLANNKSREFSNANFGDEWYALFLEQPKIQIRRQNPRMDGRPF